MNRESRYAVEEGVLYHVTQRFCEATRSGWPLGPEDFVRNLEQRAGRRLHPLPPGHAKRKRMNRGWLKRAVGSH